MHSDAAPIRRDLIHFPLRKRVAGHVLGVVAIGLRILSKCRMSSVECRMEGKSPKEVRSVEWKKNPPSPCPLPQEREEQEQAQDQEQEERVRNEKGMEEKSAPPKEMQSAECRVRNEDEKRSALTLPSPPGEGMTRATKRVMILEPFGLGDIISFEPLIRELKKRGYEIVLSGRSSWKALYPQDEQLKWIDAVLPWSSVSEEKKYRLKDYRSPEFREYIGRLRSEAKGAIGLDTRGDIRSVVVLQMARCRQVFALENYLGSNLTITPGAAKRVKFEHELHRWQLNLRFLEVLEPGFDAGKVSGPFFGHLAKRTQEKQKKIGLIPVAPWAGKLWEPKKWKSLIEELKAQGREVIGLCGPGQTQLAKQQLNSEVPVKECGSIESWAEELNQCGAVVSLDTGPMHLADALGIPTIALFGQGKLPLWAPSDPKSCVIWHRSEADFVLCQPIDENTEKALKSMRRIETGEVLGKLTL